ncbi:MAG: hypothetical protein LBQ12_14180 [Deltaproteobacteria bacterium]|jgi:hypothetical protein|nr:hypothetical protein [Deltaproteobacteria bacterium]
MARTRNWAQEAIDKREKADDAAGALQPPAPEIHVRDVSVAPAPVAPPAPAPVAPPAADPLPPFAPPPAPTPPPPPAQNPAELAAAQAELARIRLELEESRKHADDLRIRAEADAFHSKRSQEELAKTRNQLNEAARKRDIDSIVEKISEETLDVVTKKDLRVVVEAAVAAAESKQGPRLEELEKRQAFANEQVSQFLKGSYENEARSTQARLDREILAEVPEFTALMSDSAFQAYISMPIIEGSPTTRQQVMASDLKLGKSGSTVEIAKRFKETLPKIDDVVQVAPASGGVPTYAGDVKAPDIEEESRILDLRRTGKMSRQAYRDRGKAPAP